LNTGERTEKYFSLHVFGKELNQASGCWTKAK